MFVACLAYSAMAQIKDEDPETTRRTIVIGFLDKRKYGMQNTFMTKLFKKIEANSATKKGKLEKLKFKFRSFPT